MDLQDIHIYTIYIKLPWKNTACPNKVVGERETVCAQSFKEKCVIETENIFISNFLIFFFQS